MISARTMGRRHYSTRIKADYLIKLDVKWLKKMGVLREGKYETWVEGEGGGKDFKIETFISNKDNYLELSYYRKRPGWERDAWFNYTIPLVSTPCHFGGKRYWFECPIYTGSVRCGRRVGMLYLWDDWFACRHCHNLTYKSRNENRCFRSGDWKVIKISNKINELRENLKRKFYDRRLTRKSRHILKLHNKLFRASGLSPPN